MTEQVLRRRKKLRLNGFDYHSRAYVYFITVCTENKQPYFQDVWLAKTIESELEFRRAKGEITLFCYCIMPDHIHLLFSLNEDFKGTVQDWVSVFKRYTARIVNELHGIKPLWQKNFYDHIVRKEESLFEIAMYIVNNPVRSGIVSEWEAYPFSKMVDHLPF